MILYPFHLHYSTLFTFHTYTQSFTFKELYELSVCIMLQYITITIIIMIIVYFLFIILILLVLLLLLLSSSESDDDW